MVKFTTAKCDEILDAVGTSNPIKNLVKAYHSELHFEQPNEKETWYVEFTATRFNIDRSTVYKWIKIKSIE